MGLVLIADDEPGIRLLLRMTLKGAGHEVLEARDGDEALDALRSHRPCVAILDVQMPGRSGLDVCRAVRADPALAHIGLVVVTANGQADDIRAVYDAGADAYVAKPFAPSRILSVVAGLAARQVAGDHAPCEGEPVP